MSAQTYVKEKYQRDSRSAADRVNIPKGGDWNGPRDAFRHAYVSAIIARDYGQWAAKEAGDDVERRGDNTEAEHWMDYMNNATGREIGVWAAQNDKTDDEVAQEVKRRIDNGEIIINPYDPRRTFEKHGDWERAKRESAEQLQHDQEEAIKKAEKQGESQEAIKQKFDEWEEQRLQEVNRQEKKRSQIENKPSDTRTGPSHDPNPTTLPEGPSNINGPVFVHPYARRNGEVKAHTRSRPDENIGNNFSAQKSKPSTDRRASPFRQPSEDEERLPGVLYYKN